VLLPKYVKNAKEWQILSTWAYDAMELGHLFQTFQDSVVVAFSKFGLFFLDIFTLEDETHTWAWNVVNCLPNLGVSSQKNQILG